LIAFSLAARSLLMAKFSTTNFMCCCNIPKYTAKGANHVLQQRQVADERLKGLQRSLSFASLPSFLLFCVIFISAIQKLMMK